MNLNNCWAEGVKTETYNGLEFSPEMDSAERPVLGVPPPFFHYAKQSHINTGFHATIQRATDRPNHPRCCTRYN